MRALASDPSELNHGEIEGWTGTEQLGEGDDYDVSGCHCGWCPQVTVNGMGH